ncbi:hypothetical protein SERLA73DRAFT_70212 [Serpula lacrymans var. lacrymans S7.3]|uniref:DEAD/DEAH box helicase domain-containing protein n=1 Tax=Serpula lacrymans var. lacrymans (strain S7.3) TaxID=936435 RepID=F8PM94_SERL3|nr:hypothetical protein SERLA73DRAFT_70212 [Serpula lacrymans var. lacrymans S7.3]
MSTIITEAISHEDIKKRSYANLAGAATSAKNKDLRRTLEEAVHQRCNGRRPYSWQLDASEAFSLGLDCTIIVGTGSGKTLPYIISPLKTIEDKQAHQFRMWGVQSVAVNGDTYDKDLHRELKDFKYQILLASPEMTIESPQFNTFLCSPAF